MIPVICIFDLSEILLAFIFIYCNLQQFCRISLRYLNKRKHWVARNHIYFHIKIRTHLPRRHQWNINAVSRLNILWNQDGTARQGLEMIVLLVLSLSIHYGDAIMGAMAPRITSLTIVYSTVYSDADQIKHHSSASLAFVRRIHRWPVNSPRKGPVTRKMFPFDDVIMSVIVSSNISYDDLS